MTEQHVRRLSTRDEALAVDPTGYFSLAVPERDFVAAWEGEAAAAVLLRSQGALSLVFQGDSSVVASVFDEVLHSANDAAGELVDRITVPRAAASVVPFVRSGSWDWMTTNQVPPFQSREPDVIVVADDELINAFLDVANPDASTRPGDPEIEQWAAVPDPSDTRSLLAAAAITRWQSGGLVLVSVATRPDARGQGLAAAVSAFLTRRAINAGEGQVALGHYADNDVARRVYERLGFTTRSQNVSGWLSERLPSTADDHA